MLWYHVLTVLSLSLSKHFPCRLLLAVPVEPKCCSPASTNVCSGFLAPLLSVPYHALNVYSKGMHDFSAYVAPATLVMLQRCKFLDSIQVPFSLGVFLIALFFLDYIYSVSLFLHLLSFPSFSRCDNCCVCCKCFICSVFRITPRLQVSLKLAQLGQEQIPVLASVPCRLSLPLVMSLPCRLIVWALQVVRKCCKGWYVWWH